MEFVKIADALVSRFIIGGNPFSGFSHVSPEMDLRMKRYYTTARIKQTLADAEALQINTLVARADAHILRVLLEYRDEGGHIQWIAQTCPELRDHEMSIRRAADNDATGCYLHGGYIDTIFAQGRMDELPPLIEKIRERGMAAGIAGHNPDVFRWAEEKLEVDFYMCSYYNPAARDRAGQARPGAEQRFHQQDRKLMTDTIRHLSPPVIHYKVLAAGRNDPREAFAYVAHSMRPGDAVAVGVYTEQAPDMLAQDVRLFQQSSRAGP